MAPEKRSSILPLSNPIALEDFRADLRSRRAKGRVLVCSTGCRARGALDISAAFTRELERTGLTGRTEVVETGCHGQCSLAPLVVIEPENTLYGKVTVEDVPEIVEALGAGTIVERLCVPEGDGIVPRLYDTPFYRGQRKEVLANCGRVDPKEIESGLVAGDYAAAAKAFAEMAPEEIIDEMKKAGLKGRGGAGFPAGLKWEFARKAPGKEKYLVCNADEGDPGAFMDRALLEGTPHQVIEGMLIAAYAIGASHGFIYVRAEYPIAVEHVKRALIQAREYGLLGDNILGSGFSFDIDLRMGAGAFVCGEETALIASLEGQRGMPRPRPPFPAGSGYLGKPTNINNVETLANVPLIIRNGSGWYSAIGTENSPGTKIFALAGKVQNTGLVEVPMGTTLREIVYDIGGGVEGDKPFKAAQMGGPSGGCVPADYLDMPIDYETVKEAGAIVGSGGLIVMDEETCMVDVARFFLEFTQNESCGKCVPCRVGTRQMVDILERICRGEGKPGDIGELEDLAVTVKTGSLCGLGQTAPNPVLTTIRYFRDEYEAHIKDHRCPAGVCTDLITYRIDPEACRACGKCIKVCPVDAITGAKKTPHVIDESLCIRCGRCRDVCPFEAVVIE